MDIFHVPNNIRILLLAFSVLSFVPQILRTMTRKVSSGISTYYVLFNLISTTEQFALAFCYLVKVSRKSDFFVHRPVNAGNRINLAQMAIVFILWFALFVICLYLPSDHRDGSATFAICVYTGFFLISVLPVLIDAIEPNNSEDPWGEWPMAIFFGIHSFYLSWIVTGFNIAACYYQGKEIIFRPQNQALSKLGLAFQALVFASMAVSWIGRVNLPDYEGGFPWRALVTWYAMVGWAAVDTGIFAIGQAILLCIVGHHVASSIGARDGETEPLLRA